jgi:uncharacterized protein
VSENVPLDMPTCELPPQPPGYAHRFHAMVKPIGAVCNLNCAYCYYLHKEDLLQQRAPRMSEEVLEQHIRQYIEAQTGAGVVFSWQAGEPTLLGLDFFRRVVQLQKQYQRPAQRIENDLQTNGTLLDEDWARFLRAHGFLVGLSCDGPRHLHDRYRVTKGGQPTHDKMLAAARLLKKHGVSFNALCVVNRDNAKCPLDVYRFLTRELGVWRVQFIPCVEPQAFRNAVAQQLGPLILPAVGTERARPDGADAIVTEWSVDPDDWGRFLCAVWDEWYRQDYGRVHVDLFETAVAQSLGLPSQRCVTAEFCGNPPAISRFKKRFFGDHLQAWIGHLRIVLRLPYRAISQMLAEVFGEYIGGGMHGAIIERLARIYSGTERALLEEIRRSPFAHVDETQVNICGANQYVWVLTNGSAVVFRLTETRETTLIRELLSGFQGVLISDFYGGYDSMPCRQQKCFGHLIRDLNEDLWKNPYNVELEAFVGHVKELLVPIFQSANRFGLKAYHLRRFIRSVDRFYDKHVVARRYSCDITEKYRKRFARYRESLFRFLVEDGIPWNNNTAERAIRHLAVQRKISGSFGEGPMHQYLRLLGIAQTCRFQGKSFLKFLLSGEKDVRKFKQPRARMTSTVGALSGRS